jgi:hypothetical protein
LFKLDMEAKRRTEEEVTAIGGEEPRPEAKSYKSIFVKFIINYKFGIYLFIYLILFTFLIS